METRLVQCANCGAEVDLSTGECPYCVPPQPPAGDPPGSQPPSPTVGPASSTAPVPLDMDLAAPPKELDAAAERAFGLLLFEAEETLARGAADKAVVLASRAVKERPESLTARALMERARRELLRGRRRERLEARIHEARGFFEAGDLDAAGKIVTSALKLIPDHALALELFGKVKERRLAAGTAEAEAERELDRLARAQARRALDAARAALAAGWERKAVVAVLRGLRLVPDDPDLQALLRELQQSAEHLERQRAQKRALPAQIRAGLELLGEGKIAESLKILRAVLREEPGNVRAQEAVQAVRAAWLSRAVASAAPAMAVPERPPIVETPVAPPPPPRAEAPPASPALRAVPRPVPQVAPPARVPPVRERTSVDAVPAELLIRRTTSRSTPIIVFLGCAVVLAYFLFLFGPGRGGPALAPVLPQPEHVSEPRPPATTREADAGPLAIVELDLRRAIETTLGAYARALESGDASLLAAARPDLGQADRERLIAPFRGALNAATDLRVIDIKVGNPVVVSVLRTVVIVGGKVAPGPPVEETLRFERRNGTWTLR